MKMFITWDQKKLKIDTNQDKAKSQTNLKQD